MFVATIDGAEQPVERLRRAVDACDTEDLDWLSNQELGNEVVAVNRQMQRLRAQMLRRVAELDRRQGYKDDGQVSTTGWLKARCAMASGEARQHTRVARGMGKMPVMAAALRAGDIDMVRAGDLVHASTSHPDEYTRDEKVLVNNAKNLSVADHRKALAYWTQALDHQEALGDTRALFRKRRWHQSTDYTGMDHIDAELDPEAGHLVSTAIAALADPGNLDPDDTRTPAQRRADAAVDIFRFFLDHHPALPTNHGERPHGSVIIDYQTLVGVAPGRSETTDGRVLHPETIRRMLCDANITRILTDPHGMPLDVGRARRTVTAAQWKALVARDGGCVHPGCDRPPTWCDVHHKTPWAHGGRTDINDLELRCRIHHIHIHEGQTGPPPQPDPDPAPDATPDPDRTRARHPAHHTEDPEPPSDEHPDRTTREPTSRTWRSPPRR